MRLKRTLVPLVLAPTLIFAACTSDDGDGDSEEPTLDDGVTEEADDDEADAGTTTAGGTLAAVQDRGTLNCGVNDAVPGFGFVTTEGEFEGFDVDFCKVIAAAVLGDAEAVEYTPLTAEARFTALQAGEIDVLVRNTTWTATRDGAEGATFATTTFYDGQGMMVSADSGFTSLDDMTDTSICVLSGTTTELNLESVFSARGISYEPLSFEDNSAISEAFLAGRCDGWTSDKSQLAGVRSGWPDSEGGPEALTILEDTMSKEPLGPVTRDGDSEWAGAVEWAVLSTIQAWEFGIDSTNVDSMAGSVDPETDPEVARFLGVDGTDVGLNLDPAFAVNVISQVGNYQEIYNANVGPDSTLGLEPGLNNLWTEGGLLYAPPYR
jgi:general L-amino acid transport system substrate-binding protein